MVAVGGDRLSGFVLPVEPQDGNISIRALRAYAWTVDDTKRLVLDGDVHLAVGDYRFDGNSAVVWINRIPSADGLINQIAAYFDDLATPLSRAGLGAGGRRLLLTASARGEVDLQVARLDRRAAPKSSMLTRAERRLASYLEQLVVNPPSLREIPAIEGPEPETPFRPEPGGPVSKSDLMVPAEVELPGAGGGPAWLQDPNALIRFGAGRIEIVPGETENTIRVSNRVMVDYTSLSTTDDLTQLTLTAQRAVIFTEPGPLDQFMSGQIDASLVRGVYLEGNVTATTNEGEYTIRAPQAYYDLRRGQALLLDAVLRTYSRAATGPLYARAAEMRQIADQQWQAKSVRATTSDFAIGHIALGSERMLVTQRPGDEPGSDSETHIDSVGNTLRIEDVPIVWWPRFTGQITDVPLRSVSVGFENSKGVELETSWDLFSLLGRERPKWLDVELSIDGYTRRGAGGGTEVEYDVPVGKGALDLYLLYATGKDRTSSGKDVQPPSDLRGMAVWENQTLLGKSFTFQGQFSYISDPTFITSWREGDFARRREYETSLYAKWQQDIFAVDGLAKNTLNDFISNDYLLASRAYTVDRLPEFTGRLYGMSFWDGKITYSQESRISSLKFAFDGNTTEQLGVKKNAFGLPTDQAISSAFTEAGYPTESVIRLDTRHEFAAPMKLSIFDLTPYASGRLTWYSNNFDNFTTDSSDYRIFATTGVDLSTTFQRVYNNVESDLLDLHRLRHVVEPKLSMWYGYTSLDENKLPVYDQTVEPLTDGYVARFAVRNTLQTQRGGPGRWRSVNLLTVDTGVVIDNGGQKTTPTPRYFDWRPEYRVFGSHVYASATLLPSDTLSVVGEMTYSIEDSVFARGSIGIEMKHTPQLSTFVEYRFINASNNKLLGIGWAYELSRKYLITLQPQWDFVNNQFRSLSVAVVRRFPDFDLSFRIRRDAVQEQTSFSASMELVEF
jgi:hypothetical protein